MAQRRHDALSSCPAQPILGNYAARMFNKGTYICLPDETVPVIDVYDDDNLPKTPWLSSPPKHKWPIESYAGTRNPKA
jgi:hypothetical protein